MKVYGVFAIYNDGREIAETYYTSKEEAQKHLEYSRSLPWCMRDGDCYKMYISEIHDTFEPWFTEEEIEAGRKWDEENRNNQ